MRAPGCGRLALPLLLLAAAAWAESDAKGLKEGETPGNFMEDEQWLSSISQYSGKIKDWNRFRDTYAPPRCQGFAVILGSGPGKHRLLATQDPPVLMITKREVEDDYIKSWEDSQQGDEALDTTKDPCQKVKCSRHKVCIAQGFQRAMCISRKKLEHRIKQPALKLHANKDTVCKPCHMAQLASVCGSDGHTYSSVCKLEQQACLSSKQLAVRCEGPCPCPTEQATSSTTDGKAETCTGQDLADLGDRLRDWFQLLHENSKQNGSASSGGGPASGLDKVLGASCKDSIGWMFSKLDTSADLFLDQMELAAINLDKYEVCIRPFFNSCDTYKDGRVSTAEWCLCFWREKPPCLAELERIQIQEAAKKKPGVFIPSCDEDGYYRKMQCDRSGGDCWCVDQLGLELTGTRTHGSPDCDDIVGFSGDFGSGVGWEDEEEKETEEAGEEAEAEEEEGEAGEADDGGYIW